MALAVSLLLGPARPCTRAQSQLAMNASAGYTSLSRSCKQSGSTLCASEDAGTLRQALCKVQLSAALQSWRPACMLRFRRHLITLSTAHAKLRLNLVPTILQV